MRENTIADPNLGIETIYHRWFVLSTLLPLPANARGSGASLNADELLEVYLASERPYAACAGDLAQVGRHLSARTKEPNEEICLFWTTRGHRPRFGVSREPGCRELATHLLALHEGRLAAHALAEVPPLDVEDPPKDVFQRAGEQSARDLERDYMLGKDALAAAPAPAPDVAYTEKQELPGAAMQGGGRARKFGGDDGPTLEQFRAKAVEFDSRNVDAFVDGIGPGPVTYSLLAYLAGIGVAASRDALGDRIATFERMTSWERANVLFRMADLAKETIVNRARASAELARDEGSR